MSSQPAATAYVALGSNLGDRAGFLRAAAAALGRAPGVQIVAKSRMYETAAVADSPQPPYLNAVVRIDTTLTARELLGLCLATERAAGRTRPPGRDKAPRTIDLDVILHGASVIDEPGLQLPHPGLLLRAFVRVPLADVAQAGLRHPVSGDRLDLASAHPDVYSFTDGWA